MATQAKVSIIIIHYNTPQYLKTCLDAILAQTYSNIEVIFIDNNSPDKSGLDFMLQKYGQNPAVTIIANPENTGYARAANQGIRMAIEGLSAEEAMKPAAEIVEPKQNPLAADYVVITNPDIIYTPTYFEKIIPIIHSNPKIAAITGKVYKYDFENQKPTKIIDTVGLFAYRNRRIIDDGQGLSDDGQFEQESEIFGVSGACPIYKTRALQDVKVCGEYLDEDFFMYKEDVDLSWRFLLYGWKSYYYPKAIAYHGRGTGIYQRFFNREIFKYRDKLSPFQRKFSFKNQHLLETKNEIFTGFLSDFFPIISKKLFTSLYITFKEPYLWSSYLEYLKQLPRALKKRRVIMRNKKLSGRDMAKWFKTQSKYIPSSHGARSAPRGSI